MKVLIIGNGGREHTLGWALKKDSRVKKLFFAPGNAGTLEIGENLPIKASDISALTDWAKENQPDLTVVGPEAPLCAGIVDELNAIGLKVFGPNKQAAQLEGSKTFTKNILTKAGIPTAKSEAFTSSQEARNYIDQIDLPIVVKADGLASGKGVIICEDKQTALNAIEDIMDKKVFGQAGSEVLIEEFLVGEEASIHAITDGTNYQLLVSSQDHKRALNNDKGLNTGGMGAYAPAPLVTPELLATVEEKVFQPLLKQFHQEKIDYQGVLYGGLMITEAGPKVLEFNCRFGDPETQVILPLLETPLLDLILATIERTLDSCPAQFKKASALTVVLASPGYPESPQTGGKITGLDTPSTDTGVVFHAGTNKEGSHTVTSGGRVLACTGIAETLSKAKEKAYEIVDKIHFERKHFRTDIGDKALKS